VAKIDENENVNKQFKPDIPDFGKNEIPKVVLPPEVQLERDIRRYIRKDGTFVKDFERMFDADTGRMDSMGRVVYQKTMTDVQALKVITDLCDKTGRKVLIDEVTKRYAAEPGWNLEIRVPGMSQSEQNSPAITEATMREKMNQQLILSQQSQIAELTKSVKALTEAATPKAGKAPEAKTK